MTHQHAQLPVVLVQSDSNFVSLPSQFANALQSTATQGVVALRIGWLSPPTTSSTGPVPSESFVGWAGRLSDSNAIQVPSALASCIGLSSAVFEVAATTPDVPLIASVSLVRVAPIASRVDIEPLTYEDWEVIEHNAQFVEHELLNQICVLYMKQVFPIWVQHSQIRFKVTSVGADSESSTDTSTISGCVRLARDSQVVVSPKVRPVKPARELIDMGHQGVRSQPVQLRVQDTLSIPQETSSISHILPTCCKVLIHPGTFEGMRVAAHWPEVSIEPVCSDGKANQLEEQTHSSGEGTVIRKNSKGEMQPLIVWLSGKKIVFTKPAADQPRDPASQYYVPVTLFVSSEVAPSHVAVPSNLRRRCGLQVLGKALLTLACFEHVSMLPAQSTVTHSDPTIWLKRITWASHSASEAGEIHDTMSTEQCDTNSTNSIEAPALRRATAKWLKANTCGGGVHSITPIFDGSVISLRFDDTPTTIDFRVSLSTEYLKDVQSLVSSPLDTRVEAPYVLLDTSKCDAALFQSGPGVSIIDPATKFTEIEPLGAVQLLEPLVQHSTQLDGESLSSLGAVDDIADRITHKLSLALSRNESKHRVKLGTPQPGGVYLCGDRGSGKSTLSRAIGHHFGQDRDSLANVVVVSCKVLKGGKRSGVQQAFEAAFRKAVTNSPSLLVFDDLDVMLPAANGGPDSSEDAQTVWLAEWLEEQIRSYREHVEAIETFTISSLAGDEDAVNRMVWNTKSVGWLATGADKRSLRASLLASGLFDSTEELQPLTAHSRCDVLQAVLSKQLAKASLESELVNFSIHPNLDLDEFASSAEGYQAGDLEMLASRAVHAATIRSIAGKVENDNQRGNPRSGEYAIFEPTGADNQNSKLQVMVCAEDFVSAKDGFTPVSLQGAVLMKSDVRWDDVGGLKQVRTVLKDTLELPMLFAPLFERSPQKLASGILLYGPPGCGKTLLAGAVARECGLNFISVKGPEVLNKYIGASEQAVRDLFARGAAAAPCILFFDEFDAVAPRRGNDSSGVTDRVVNQLLTFLDGVESRSGVYVMAATSRPDLVDPALLRPGRLDKQLMCGFPDADEREDILNTIAAKMTLSEAAKNELHKLANHPTAELFTGADLQAILYSAQLDAVHSQLPDDPSAAANVTTQDGPSPIEPEHIHKAMEGTRASVSKEERERYLRIYQAFLGGRGADFEAVSGYPDGKQRTALK